MKSYHSKSFEQVLRIMESRHDLQPNQTPYPPSWFSVDIKIGSLSIHLDEDSWNKCNVSEMSTNVELMIGNHLMDQGSKVNYDIEEKQINLGRKLVLQEFTSLYEELSLCEQEAAKGLLGDNFKDFKMLLNYHLNEIKRYAENLEAEAALRQQQQRSDAHLSSRNPSTKATEQATPGFTPAGTESDLQSSKNARAEPVSTISMVYI